MKLRQSLALHSGTLMSLYENLRKATKPTNISPSSSGQGMALFLYRGMASWIEAWSEQFQSTEMANIKTKNNCTVPRLSPSTENELVIQLANIGITLAGGFQC